MGEGMLTSVVIILIVLLAIAYYAHTRWKGKLLCVFHTETSMRVETSVPVNARHVRFAARRRGDKGLYHVLPKYFENTWYNKGVNMFFPVLLPTQEWRWNSPEPIDPKTSQSSWHTPEVRYSAWQEHSHKGFTAAAAAQVGKKQSSLERYMPLIILGVCMITLILVYQMG